MTLGKFAETHAGCAVGGRRLVAYWAADALLDDGMMVLENPDQVLIGPSGYWTRTVDDARHGTTVTMSWAAGNLDGCMHPGWPPPRISYDPTRFPHRCAACGGPAYVGFLRIEHPDGAPCTVRR